VIWDSSRQAWDGSSEPLYMPLTQGQLRSGSVTYTSFSFTEKVRFRLDTTSKSGDAASESLVSVSPLSITSPSSPPTLPAPTPTAENLPPYEPRHSVPANLLPAPPLRSSSRPAKKRFVPPQSAAVSAPRENVMPDPPNLVVEVVAGVGFQPGAFHPNASPAPAPPPSQPVSGTSAALSPAAIPEPAGGRSREGVVTITSEPSGAKVEINAVPAGVTPLTLQITPVGLGFTVTVTKNGFMKWTVQSFSTAQPYSLHAQLRANPK
jgi:PEGA domain